MDSRRQYFGRAHRGQVSYQGGERFARDHVYALVEEQAGRLWVARRSHNVDLQEWKFRRNPQAGWQPMD